MTISADEIARRRWQPTACSPALREHCHRPPSHTPASQPAYTWRQHAALAACPGAPARQAVRRAPRQRTGRADGSTWGAARPRSSAPGPLDAAGAAAADGTLHDQPGWLDVASVLVGYLGYARKTRDRADRPTGQSGWACVVSVAPAPLRWDAMGAALSCCCVESEDQKADRERERRHNEDRSRDARSKAAAAAVRTQPSRPHELYIPQPGTAAVQ